MQNRNQSDVRVPELDGIRGLAILLVVFSHFASGAANHSANYFTAYLKDGTSLTWSGVELFFVLSGFLIGGILMDKRGSEGYFKTFYIRRGCRILPLYILWMVLFFIVAELLVTAIPPAWYSMEFGRIPDFPQWGFFLFLQNFFMAQADYLGGRWFNITWSLCVEEQFYLLAPLAIWVLPPRKLPAVLVSLVVFMPLFRVFLHAYDPSLFVYPYTPCRLDGFLLGILCACLVRNAQLLDLVKRNANWLYLLFVILFGGMVCLATYLAGQTWEAGMNSFGMLAWGYSWIDIFYACFLLIAVTIPVSPIAAFMRSRPLRHFGAISYCIYLIHSAVVDFVHHLIPETASAHWHVLFGTLATVSAFLLTWLLALLSWKFVENPLIQWGHSFLYTRREASSKNEVPAGIMTMFKRTEESKRS